MPRQSLTLQRTLSALMIRNQNALKALKTVIRAARISVPPCAATNLHGRPALAANHLQ